MENVIYQERNDDRDEDENKEDEHEAHDTYHKHHDKDGGNVEDADYNGGTVGDECKCRRKTIVSARVMKTAMKTRTMKTAVNATGRGCVY